MARRAGAAACHRATCCPSPRCQCHRSGDSGRGELSAEGSGPAAGVFISVRLWCYTGQMEGAEVSVAGSGRPLTRRRGRALSPPVTPSSRPSRSAPLHSAVVRPAALSRPFPFLPFFSSPPRAPRQW